jgi:hypothetical protein
MTLLLSQYIGVGSERGTPISESNNANYFNSCGCHSTIFNFSRRAGENVSFLLFQEMRESPRKIHNPVVDLRSVGSPTQLASE